LYGGGLEFFFSFTTTTTTTIIIIRWSITRHLHKVWELVLIVECKYCFMLGAEENGGFKFLSLIKVHSVIFQNTVIWMFCLESSVVQSYSCYILMFTCLLMLDIGWKEQETSVLPSGAAWCRCGGTSKKWKSVASQRSHPSLLASCQECSM
jgi:hypothetical protein